MIAVVVVVLVVVLVGGLERRNVGREMRDETRGERRGGKEIRKGLNDDMEGDGTRGEREGLDNSTVKDVEQPVCCEPVAHNLQRASQVSDREKGVDRGVKGTCLGIQDACQQRVDVDTGVAQPRRANVVRDLDGQPLVQGVGNVALEGQQLGLRQHQAMVVQRCRIERHKLRVRRVLDVDGKIRDRLVHFKPSELEQDRECLVGCHVWSTRLGQERVED